MLTSLVNQASRDPTKAESFRARLNLVLAQSGKSAEESCRICLDLLGVGEGADSSTFALLCGHQFAVKLPPC